MHRNHCGFEIGSDLRVGLSDPLTDYSKKSLTFDYNFKIVIPNQEDWDTRTPMATEATHIYTYSSKMSNGVGAGVFSADLNLLLWLRLDSHGTVFQAEIFAILKAAEAIKHLVSFALTAGPQSWHWPRIGRSPECCQLLRTSIPSHPHVGHADIEGNEEADRLVRRGSESIGALPSRVFKSMAGAHELGIV